MTQNVKLSRFLFNMQDGTLNEDAKLACQCLHIPHQKLIPKTLQDFKEPGVSDEIAGMRLQYYEDKRRVFTKQVEETIRSGIIDDVKNEFPPMVKQPTAMNRTAGSVGRPMQIFGSTTSPRMVLSKHTMGFVQDYGLDMPQSTLPPEIMLRDPLDQEFVLNRKMAKKYYESQLQNKMSENRQKNLEESEKKKKAVQDVEAKKEKAITDLRKADQAVLQQNINRRNADDYERRTMRETQNEQKAAQIVRTARREFAARKERQNKAKEDYDLKLTEQFERDKANRQNQANKGSEAAMKARENEKIMVTKLESTAIQFEQKIQSKEAQLRMKQEKAMLRAERINEQAARKREEDKKKEEQRLLDYCNKIEKVKTKRNEVSKAIRSASINPHKIHHAERLLEIKTSKDEEMKQQARKIKQGIKQRETQVERNLSYLQEENERRKEVKNLHKIDQEDNLQRKQAFERMGLENRVQMILEKASRVQKPLF